MPENFGKTRARREGFSRQQRDYIGLRVGKISLPSYHSHRCRAGVGLDFRSVLPGGNDQKPRQVPAASRRALAGFASPYRVGSEHPYDKAPPAPERLQR